MKVKPNEIEIAEKNLTPKTLKVVLHWYFKQSYNAITRKVHHRIKGEYDADKHDYVKNLISTMIVGIMQMEKNTMAFKKTYFDGCLTEVLNKHKDIHVKYKEWNLFEMNSFDETEANRIINEFYTEYEKVWKDWEEKYEKWKSEEHKGSKKDNIES